jgi:hypothetical protein
VAIQSGGAGANGGGSSGSSADPEERVVVTGGGGCTCSVPGASPAGGPSNSGVLAALCMLAFALSRRRLRAGWLGAKPLSVAALLAALLGAGGCKVDAFCLTCEETKADADGGAPGGNFNNADGSVGGGFSPDTGIGNGGSDKDGGPGGIGSGADGGPGSGNGDAGSSPVCSDHEICNGIDDDCDKKVDEDVDPKADGIDLQTDVDNCG